MRVICLLLVALLSGAAGQPLVRISGVVRDITGAALPGATVTVTERGVTRGEAVTDENGAFEIGGLLAETYSVTATLAGFRPQTQDVRLTAASAEPLAFALRVGMLTEVLWVMPEPREAHRRAHAIAHLRIDATLPPAPCGDAMIVSASHRAGVVAVWKGVLPASIQLHQEAAGVCFDGSVSVEGLEKTYQLGDEYLIFLMGSGEQFGRLVGPHLAFPVQDGRVHTREFAGLPEFMTLAEFGAALKQLSR